MFEVLQYNNRVLSSISDKREIFIEYVDAVAKVETLLGCELKIIELHEASAITKVLAIVDLCDNRFTVCCLKYSFYEE